MAAITIEELRRLDGHDVYDRDANKIGVVEEVFANDADRAEFIGIGTGFLRMGRALVPAESAVVEGDAIRVPFAKDTVKASPDVSGDYVDEAEARRLYDHYGLEPTPVEPRADHDRPGTEREAGDVVRHEEEVKVGKRDVPAGTVRLRKWVDTEQVATDVELEREEAVVRREPVDRDARAGEIGEDAVEVELHEQEPVVEKNVEAKERIEVDKRTRQEHQPVSETVLKEHVDLEEDPR